MTLASEVGRLIESAASRPCLNAPDDWDEMTDFEQDLWLDSVGGDAQPCLMSLVASSDDRAFVPTRY
jgi:hypothetical protein